MCVCSACLGRNRIGMVKPKYKHGAEWGGGGSYLQEIYIYKGTNFQYKYSTCRGATGHPFWGVSPEPQGHLGRRLFRKKWKRWELGLRVPVPSPQSLNAALQPGALGGLAGVPLT